MFRVTVACDVCGTAIATGASRGAAALLAKDSEGFRRHNRLHFCSEACWTSEEGMARRKRPTREEQAKNKQARRDEHLRKLLAEQGPSELDGLTPQQLAAMIPRSLIRPPTS